jgi:hypothetical protein
MARSTMAAEGAIYLDEIAPDPGKLPVVVQALSQP